jgi:hypothetical protein
MTTKSAVASSLIAVALMSGCATPFHGSWLIGERYYKTNLDTQPVIILGVDNQDTTERRVLVEPGEHVIRVQATPTPGAPWETASFKLDVKPCFTYYIVAVRENPIIAAFTPRVDYAEPLGGGCTPNPPAKTS